MRREILSFVAAGALLFGASNAFAASPQDIAADLADNGCLNGTYTQAELDAYAQSATVQGYGTPVLVVTLCPPTSPTPPVTPVAPPVTPVTPVQPVVTPVGVSPAQTPAAGVAGTQKTIKIKPLATPAAQVAGAQTPPIAQTAAAGTLPFTGSELGIFALVGAALLAGGIVLRASSRGR